MDFVPEMPVGVSGVMTTTVPVPVWLVKVLPGCTVGPVPEGPVPTLGVMLITVPVPVWLVKVLPGCTVEPVPEGPEAVCAVIFTVVVGVGGVEGSTG